MRVFGGTCVIAYLGACNELLPSKQQLIILKNSCLATIESAEDSRE